MQTAINKAKRADSCTWRSECSGPTCASQTERQRHTAKLLLLTLPSSCSLPRTRVLIPHLHRSRAHHGSGPLHAFAWARQGRNYPGPGPYDGPERDKPQVTTGDLNPGVPLLSSSLSPLIQSPLSSPSS